MKRVQVFDPAMCCSTGVCGPKVDPALARFAADLNWLATRNVVVERYNLAQQPEAFAGSGIVKAALVEYGNECPPLILSDGSIVSRGRYPTRDDLAALSGVESGAGEAAAEEPAPAGLSLPVIDTRCC